MHVVIAISTRLLNEEAGNVGTRLAPITKLRIPPINVRCEMYHTMHTVPYFAHRCGIYMNMPFGHLNDISVVYLIASEAKTKHYLRFSASVGDGRREGLRGRKGSNRNGRRSPNQPVRSSSTAKSKFFLCSVFAGSPFHRATTG